MTSASNQMITRCPKCGTAFRVTPSQLQSAKGAVRCGSCLNVFKAQDYLVSSATTPADAKKTTAAASTLASTAITAATKPADSVPAHKLPAADKPAPASSQRPAEKHTLPAVTSASQLAKQPQTAPTPLPTANKPVAAPPAQPPILSAIKPLPINPSRPAATTPAAKPVAEPAAKPVVRTINKSSLKQADDVLISDNMDDSKSRTKSYDFDGFIDAEIMPKSDISLFERKARDKNTDGDERVKADESWAEMLIEEEEDIPQLGVLKPKTDEQLADADLLESHKINPTYQGHSAKTSKSRAPIPTPGLVFSLIGEKEETPKAQEGKPAQNEPAVSDKVTQTPSHKATKPSSSIAPAPDPGIFEIPDDASDETSDGTKRQVKTQPKMRTYDGSRTALLMNIIPAPIEFSAKRMRRWYQRKLWPSLSLLGLLALVIQVGWFKFDYFSRVEPYRTGYLFLCPYLGCQVPTLVDTSRIIASNLVVREHPDTKGALAVDVMLMNGAPFEQPFPDLVLVFTDINDNQVASRRFSSKDYLGGELIGRELMPQNQKIHITLDLVDPGAEAVNYHISIPRQ